jgi:hypothetical protein
MGYQPRNNLVKNENGNLLADSQNILNMWKNYFSQLWNVLIKENMAILIDASKEVGLEINVEKTKYMLLSRQKNVGQNRDIKIENRSFENVSQFKYLGTTVTNHNLIQEEIEFW